jgi:hypothetical protein
MSERFLPIVYGTLERFGEFLHVVHSRNATLLGMKTSSNRSGASLFVSRVGWGSSFLEDEEGRGRWRVLRDPRDEQTQSATNL